MRIAVVTETYPPEVNGVALTVQNLVSGMAEDGHDLVLVRPFQPGVSTLPPARPIHEMLVRGAALPKYPGLRFGFPAGRQLKRLFETRRPDAVYVATEGPLGWSAVRTARQLGIPVATGFHTRFDAYAGAYGLGPLTPLVRYWLRRLHNASGATVVPTPELREWLERHGFQRVRVVARGVDTKLFDPARRRQKLRDRWGIAEGGLAVIYSAASRRKRISRSQSSHSGEFETGCPMRASSGSAPGRKPHASHANIPISCSRASGSARTLPSTSPPRISSCSRA